MGNIWATAHSRRIEVLTVIVLKFIVECGEFITIGALMLYQLCFERELETTSLRLV